MLSLADCLTAHNANPGGRRWPRYGGGDHDRRTTLGASEAALCLRRIFYAKRGPDTLGAAQDWGFANRGHQVEAYVVAALRERLPADHRMILSGSSQRTLVHPTLPVSATPDGIILGPDSVTYLEVKSVDPRTNPGNLPRAEHVLQAQIGMALAVLRLPAKSRPTHGTILHVDASSLRPVLSCEVHPNPDAVTRAAQRWARTQQASQPEELPAEGTLDGSCRLCPYKAICPSGAPWRGETAAAAPAPVPAAPAAPGVPDPLDVLALRLLELKELDKEKDRITADLKKIFGARDTDHLSGPGWTATLKYSAGSERIDRAKVEALAARTQTPMETLTTKSAPSAALSISRSA